MDCASLAVSGPKCSDTDKVYMRSEIARLMEALQDSEVVPDVSIIVFVLDPSDFLCSRLRIDRSSLPTPTSLSNCVCYPIEILAIDFLL